MSLCLRVGFEFAFSCPHSGSKKAPRPVLCGTGRGAFRFGFLRMEVAVSEDLDGQDSVEVFDLLDHFTGIGIFVRDRVKTQAPLALAVGDKAGLAHRMEAVGGEDIHDFGQAVVAVHVDPEIQDHADVVVGEVAVEDVLDDVHEQRGNDADHVHAAAEGKSDRRSGPDAGGCREALHDLVTDEDHAGAEKADAGDDRCRHTARVAGADVLETVLGDEHEQTRSKRDGRVGADARFLGPVLPLKADTGARRQSDEKADDPFILKH